MIPSIYAAMHFFVDFICALAMFSVFRLRSGAYFQLLVYNFCAFALQMPLGTLLDVARSRTEGRLHNMLALIWAGLGVLLTFLGAFTAPSILGLGNALFHVGGGLDVIDVDFSGNRQGRDLGVFVAPGAVGLYLGTVLGTQGVSMVSVLLPTGILAALFALLVVRKRRQVMNVYVPVQRDSKIAPLLIFGCFAVVILRSFTGFALRFSWKAVSSLSWLNVIAVAAGKMAGGFLAARWGMKKAICISLTLSAICFLLGEIPIFGIVGVFLFNMTMPVTLYLLAENMPDAPGFAFGLLTFCLFLGFLPMYANWSIPVSPGIIGAAGSILSLLLLTLCGKAVKHAHIHS